MLNTEKQNRFEKSEKFTKITTWADGFFHSYNYIFILTIIGALGFIAREEVIAIYLIVTIACIGLILVPSISPFMFAVLMVGLTPLARHNQAEYFVPLYPVILVLVIAIFLRIVYQKSNFRLGRFFAPTLAIAIAITLGGLGFITLEQYFSLPAIYYVIGLGFGMFIIYVIMESNIPCDNIQRNTDFFAKMMIGVGIMGIIMVAYTYLAYYSANNFDLTANPPYFQWKNNLSNNLLISMPFAFYLAAKKNSLLYFIIGLLQFFAAFLSFSRGGVIFGSLIFPFAMIICLYYAKKSRVKFVIPLIILIIIFSYFISHNMDYFERVMRIRGDESRANMYRLAYEYFKEYPIFGTGLAHNPGVYYRPRSMALYWYHSTFFQIIASLGIVGLGAYAMQMIYRIKAIFSARTSFNVFFALSILGFAGYSMVNVGYFVPLPFVVIILFMFIVLDRNNSLIKCKKNV